MRLDYALADHGLIGRRTSAREIQQKGILQAGNEADGRLPFALAQRRARTTGRDGNAGLMCLEGAGSLPASLTERTRKQHVPDAKAASTRVDARLDPWNPFVK